MISSKIRIFTGARTEIDFNHISTSLSGGRMIGASGAVREPIRTVFERSVPLCELVGDM